MEEGRQALNAKVAKTRQAGAKARSVWRDALREFSPPRDPAMPPAIAGRFAAYAVCFIILFLLYFLCFFVLCPRVSGVPELVSPN